MVVPKLVRYLGAASLILVIWLLFHTTATTRPIPEYGEPSWSDPNKNCQLKRLNQSLYEFVLTSCSD